MRAIPVLLLQAALAFSQTAPKETTLTIKGYTGQAPVIQLNGKSYVEIESLARLTNGALTFQTNQITLTLNAPIAKAAPVDPAAKLALSKDFLRAAIEELSVIRDWRTAIQNAVQNNAPVTDEMAGNYNRNASTKLALASAAASKDADRQALPLVTNEFNNMKKLSDQFLTLHKNQTYISPDSLDNDPLNQQVQNCALELAALANSGQFQDVPVCH